MYTLILIVTLLSHSGGISVTPIQFETRELCMKSFLTISSLESTSRPGIKVYGSCVKTKW